VNEYISNILAAWESATPAQQELGLTWYARAHKLALDLGNGNASLGAGLIAALSPNKRWDLNVRLARDAADGWVHGHTASNLAKVNDLLKGKDPLTVFSSPRALKTRNFYLNILDPSDPFPVTIDRHAWDVATGTVHGNAERGITPKRYQIAAEAFRAAGAFLGLPGSTVQAGTWQALRESLAGTSFRGTFALTETERI
jgi:hypothetical protein